MKDFNYLTTLISHQANGNFKELPIFDYHEPKLTKLNYGLQWSTTLFKVGGQNPNPMDLDYMKRCVCISRILNNYLAITIEKVHKYLLCRVVELSGPILKDLLKYDSKTESQIYKESSELTKQIMANEQDSDCD